MRRLAPIVLGLALLAPASAQDSALPAETRALFESVRTAAIAHRTALVGDPESLTVRRLQAIQPQRSLSPQAWAELTDHHDGTRTQWVSDGLRAQLHQRAQGRPQFAQRVLALILCRQLVTLWTVSPVDEPNAEAVRVFARLDLPGGGLTPAEAQAAVELLTESRGLELECRKAFLDIGPMKCDYVPRWKVRARHGPVGLQVRRMLRAAEALTQRGLAQSF